MNMMMRIDYERANHSDKKAAEIQARHASRAEGLEKQPSVHLPA